MRMNGGFWGTRADAFVAQALVPAASTLVSRPVFASRRVSTLQTKSLRHGPSSRRPLNLKPMAGLQVCPTTEAA